MLNNGVCGFRYARSSNPPVSDVAQFKKDCFAVSYPLVAFASSVEAFNIKFTDNKLLLRELPEFYQVLSKEDLSSTISDRILVNLNRAELEQVKYWKPQTLGELIFNYWD